MPEKESTRYSDAGKDKSIKRTQRFNQPTHFHPDRIRGHEDVVDVKNRDK